jgi:hypothetical protein
MGRPLGKKYMGNRNTGGIGGTGVTSVAVTTGGTYSNAGNVTMPTATFNVPELPGGVRSTASLKMGAASAAVVSSGSGTAAADYKPTDVLTLAGGTGTAATFTVANVSIRTAAASNIGAGYQVGDNLVFSGTGWTSNAIITVATLGVGNGVSAISVANPGVWGNATLPVDPVTPSSTTSVGGTNVTFNLGFGINSVTSLTAGLYSVLPANPNTPTSNSANGTSGTLNVQYTINGVTMGNIGSGYSATPVLTPSSAGQGSVPVFVVTPTTNATPSFNVSANITGVGSKVGDIVKQESACLFVVTTADGTDKCQLVVTAPNQNECRLTAVDSDAGTYYINKISGRTATVTRGTGVQFTTGSKVAWNMVAAVSGQSIKINTVG